MAYYAQHYATAVNTLEDSLEQYLLAEDECRAFCDGEFDHGEWYPDLITSIGSKCGKMLKFTYIENFQIILRLRCTANIIVRAN